MLRTWMQWGNAVRYLVHQGEIRGSQILCYVHILIFLAKYKYFGSDIQIHEFSLSISGPVDQTLHLSSSGDACPFSAS